MKIDVAKFIQILPVTRMIGASRWKNVSCSITLAQISAPIPTQPMKKIERILVQLKNVGRISQLRTALWPAPFHCD